MDRIPELAGEMERLRGGAVGATDDAERLDRLH